jgi:hypothetical protein
MDVRASGIPNRITANFMEQGERGCLGYCATSRIRFPVVSLALMVSLEDS